MANAFVGTGKRLSAEELAKVEGRIGLTLPSSLREHYLKHNGGRPKKSYFVDGDHELDVHHFNKMLDERSELGGVFEKMYEVVVQKKKLIPVRLIPFAINQGGDFFCMDKETEEIFFYEMDYCLEPERAARKLAPSLAYFLEHMVNEDDLDDLDDE